MEHRELPSSPQIITSTSLLKQWKDKDDIIRIKVMRKEQVAPKQWKMFMRNVDDKTDLINFLLIDWSTNERHILVL